MFRDVQYRLTQVAIILVALVAPPAVGDEKVEQRADVNTAASPQQIAGWIGQLDDNRYLVREQATQQLLDAGGAALDPLLAVANGERPEPADRAVWIMRRLARSRDAELAMSALEHLVQLEGRPALVEKAEIDLFERSIAVCQARLIPLGAEFTIEPTQFEPLSVVPVLHIRLGEKWKGTSEDLRCLAKLRRQLHFRLEGKAINDAVVKFFEEKEKLAVLYLWNVQVSTKAIDSLKARHPDTIVYVRGDALMGVEAVNHQGGVIVKRVEPTSGAAAAGIAVGDVLATMDGESIPDFDRLTARIAQHQPGETVELEILRGNERSKVSVTLGRRPENQ